ncbi:MAG: PAS domain S-box protein, partial [Vallitaleaceae bacterium]|nr:PAS domain S-box protein [Vallitaleaceae bacterium]
MPKIDNNTQQPGYEYFRALVSNMPMIFYVLDQDGIFTLSDGLGLQKLGLQPGQVVGVSAYEMYKDFPDILDVIRSAYTGKEAKAEHTLGSLQIENHVAPYYDSMGNIKGVVGATIDITDRKNAERELKRANAMTEAILESVPGMLYLYSAEGQLVYWNKNHEIITGYSPEELAQMTLVSWYKDDPESIASIQKGLEITAQGGVGFAEADLQCKDGTRIPMYFTAKSLEIDQKTYFVGTGIDITQRKIAEQKLLELNHTLEAKVVERTQELVKANIELSAANEELTAVNEELNAMNEEIQAMNEELIDTNEKIREMQSYLVESEKMAALGNMVAGISHEINTPVGVGVTAASHLSDLAQEVSALKKEGKLTDNSLTSYLEDMEKASHII